MNTILFLIFQLTPGDPAEVVLGDSATPENVAKLRQMWGLNDPLHIQIIRFIGNALQGDLGTSFVTYRPVLLDIVTFFPATLELTFAGLIVATLLGVPEAVLAEHGTISSSTSLALARGARDRFGVECGVGVTGAAGPTAPDGASKGEIHLAVVTPEGEFAERHVARGDRTRVREWASKAALMLLLKAVRGRVQ